LRGNWLVGSWPGGTAGVDRLADRYARVLNDP